jgi:hypothetical protein
MIDKTYTPPLNPYAQYDKPPEPTVAERVKGFMGEHQLKIGISFATMGFLLLIAGIVSASIAGHVHSSHPDLSQLSQQVMDKGIILAVVGGVLGGLGVYLWTTAKPQKKREEETPLTIPSYEQRVAAKRANRAATAFLALALIAFIGIQMAATGSNLSDTAAMNAGITFSVISGVGSIASFYFMRKYHKQKGEME